MPLTAAWRQKQIAEINRFVRVVRKLTPITLERPVFLKLASTILEALVVGNVYGNPTGTPVQTGNARAQWWVAYAPTATSGEAPDPSGAVTMAKGLAFLMGQDIEANPVVFFTNGAPYAIRLEYGWSQQAPSGMVRIVVSNYERLVTDVLAWAKTYEPRLAGADDAD